MKKIKKDFLTYLIFIFFSFSIVILFHNKNAIRFAIIYYLTFTFMFWIFYLFSLRFKFIKIYFISIFCLTLLEFYFNTFYFNLFYFLGVLGILESILFNYVALCFFVLDVMLYLSRRKYDQRSHYRLNSLQRNAIYPTYHSEHFIAYTQQSKCGKNLVYILNIKAQKDMYQEM